MTTKYWLGIADAIAQVSSVQVTAFDAATTYQLTIGGIVISAIGNTDVNTTATDLAAAWNASTHPYCAGVTAVAVTDTVTLTADTAGAPFVAASSVAGGTGTIGAVAAVTANSGPNAWGVGANWSDGAIPTNGDTVILKNNSVNVCWDLDQSGVAIFDLFIEKTYTGKVGLNQTQFATSADGDTTDASKPDYRDHYLQIDVDTIEVGKHVGTGSAPGSGRIKIDNKNTGACYAFIFSTANIASEANLAAVRLLFASATANLNVRAGSVGVAIDEATEISTVGDVNVNGRTADVYIGAGATITNLRITDGNAMLQAAATVALIDVEGGVLITEGDYTITALNIQDGVVYCNNVSAGNAITTLNINGGVISGIRSSAARTWSIVNLNKGATLEVNPDSVTITTLNEPSGVKYSIAVS